MSIAILTSYDLQRYAWFYYFFFNDTATTEIYTLSLHDALPICARGLSSGSGPRISAGGATSCGRAWIGRRADSSHPARPRRRSEEHTLNSSHSQISYAVFCLKKKNPLFTLTGRTKSADKASTDR